MKVYIGPYIDWIGPYQIAEKIPFLSEETKENIGCWLSKTWVATVCEWFYSKEERKIKVRIDHYDTWSMDNTLAHIILPMLKQLRDAKHGAPLVDDEDLPPQMRYNDADPGYDENGVWRHAETQWFVHRWDWVLNEMIWAFEQELDDSWEEQFRHGEPQYEWELLRGNEDDDSGVYAQNQLNPDYWVDYEGMREYNNRIQNGFRLFGKYYQNLWD
jgi:hypothetical protein